MAKGRNKNKILPYVPGLYPEDTNDPLVSNSTFDYTGKEGVNYKNSTTQKILTGGVETTRQADPDSSVTDDVWLMDIAQSHHYAIQISGMKMSEFKSPKNTYSRFLPVKTMSLKYTSYENMSIPVAIFGDFPILNRKRVSTIDLSCYDLDNNKLEYELRAWEAQCFPKGRYVAYMDDIARRFTYRGYNVKGQQTLSYVVWVIPAGNVTVSRDYSANEAKMLNFSLVVVGDGQTCASGSGKKPGIMVEDHGGLGDSRIPKGDFATLYVSGLTTYDDKGKSIVHDVGTI